MITVHHLEQSRSFRILWALEELGQPYQIEFYRRLPSFAAPPELKRVHPLGKAPILTDGGQPIAESAVILEYLQEQYDPAQQFKPTHPADQQQYRYWMHYAEGSLMPLLVMQLVASKVPQRAPWLIRPVAAKVSEGIQQGFIQPRLKDHIQFLEDYLATHDYFAGTFSFADIQMAFPLQALQSRTDGKYPQIERYLQRLAQREGYQRAFAREQKLETQSA